MFATVRDTGTQLFATELSMRPRQPANLIKTEEGDVIARLALTICSHIVRNGFEILELLFCNAQKWLLVTDQ